MSEDAVVDLIWWKTAKAVSIDRKKRAAISSASTKPGDSFLIVTEGTVTEPVYFDLLLRDLQLSVVRIKVQPGDTSDPHHVIYTAEREAKQQEKNFKKGTLGIDEPARFDHVWAVVDTDVAVRMGFWHDVQQLAAARKVKLAHSTPCFEYWLLLHVVGLTTRGDLYDGKAAKSALKEALGCDYSTNKKTAKAAMESLLKKWPEAVRHAETVRQHHQGAGTTLPANPSTEVDCLVRALNDAALEHMRKL